MSVAQAAALGIIQGLTEFLPVSSSGHLLLFKMLFSIDVSEAPLLFDVGVHAATLLVVVVYLRQQIWGLLGAALNTLRPSAVRDSQARSLLLELVVASAGTAVVGYACARIISGSSLRVAAFGFMVTAILLVVQFYFRKNNESAPIARRRLLQIIAALVVGCAQGWAVLPGISRAGATICVALIVGMRWHRALNFSLLLSIPAIVGAFAFSVVEYYRHAQYISPTILLTGMGSALITGVAALSLLLLVVRKSYLHLFVPYLVLLSIVSFILSR